MSKRSEIELFIGRELSGLSPPPVMSKDELIRKAVEHYNGRQMDFAMRRREYDFRTASEHDDPGFLNRICVNYLRHHCTNYDSAVRAFLGRVGTSGAYVVVKCRVLGLIAEAYHDLADECGNQRSTAEFGNP